jgi:quinoprotein glucose dehydrogenase
MLRWVLPFAGATAACVATGCTEPSAVASTVVAPVATWTHYAGDPGALRFSRVLSIDTASVRRLRPAWSWATEEVPKTADGTGEWITPGKFEATPVAIGDTLVLTTPYNHVVAVDGTNGRTLWRFDPGATARGLIADDRAGFVHRGVAVWTDGKARRILVASRWQLLALDASTGEPISSFGTGGRVDLVANLRRPVNRQHVGNTSPPVVVGDLVIVGSVVGDRLVYENDPPGDVQAFDVRTGERRWQWSAIPSTGDSARATWTGQSADVTGHANVWAPFSADTARGLVYLPVSAASNDYYGGNRLGDNLYTQSLVCLDVRTGVMRWARQLVHHDLWDYDPASPPALVTLDRGNIRVDAVLMATKTGELFGFNRVTGEPLWSITEQPAPPSDVPGERAAPTQPQVLGVAPFARQGFSEDDLIDFTPELRAEASRIFARYRSGPIFQPPSLTGTIQSPGWIGGAGWGSMAVDPVRQVAYVKATNLPVLAKVVPTRDDRRFMTDSALDPSAPLSLRLEDGRSWLPSRFRAKPVNLPIAKPPYGTFTAIDLRSGRHLWQVTLGDTPAIRSHPRLQSLRLPPLGVAGAPGGVATSSGLIFITGGGDVLYAIESATGRTLWSADLGQMGYANPMIFESRRGRPFVVIATGNGAGATLRAFTLDP